MADQAVSLSETMERGLSRIVQLASPSPGFIGAGHTAIHAIEAGEFLLNDPFIMLADLVRDTAFAGVATRRSSLILTLKSAKDIRSPRIEKRERTSPGRWHLEVRLKDPADVDKQLTLWLSAAYELSGR